MAFKEINFIRPFEVYTPSTGKSEVKYKGYDGADHNIELGENLEGDVEDVINDTFVTNTDGNVAFTDENNVAHELLTPAGIGKAQVISTTYGALKALRDGGNLVAGSLYRITDYVTTTAQEGTQSAGHQFDIVLLALSEDKLAEEGWAMLHTNDTYFANSNLSAWKVWYCLDNDTARFAWADDSVPQIYDAGNDIWLERDATKDQDNYFAWYNSEDDATAYTKTLPPKVGEQMYIYTDGSGWQSAGDIYNVKGFGRGVIYRLIDEFNNDLPYDFKNILLAISLTDGIYDPDSQEDPVYVYTFSSTYADDACSDLSLTGVATHVKIGEMLEGGIKGLSSNIFYQNGEDSPVFSDVILGVNSFDNFFLIMAVACKFGVSRGSLFTRVENIVNVGYLSQANITDADDDKVFANGVEIATVQGE